MTHCLARTLSTARWTPALTRVLTRPVAFLLLLGAQALPLAAQQVGEFLLSGQVVTAAGLPIAGAMVSAGALAVQSDVEGHYALRLPGGIRHIHAAAGQDGGFATDLDLESDQTLRIALSPDTLVTVHGGQDVRQPDPSATAYGREDLLPANPGRPGVPFSVPGFPTETASGGIKAPQYFAPGVAGDHGEPIAQFFQVGSFLFPNNLTANAHGNGYADPNIVVPLIVGGVAVDNAAFNARYGDHSINLAVDYTLRDRVSPTVAVVSDGRDGDLQAVWAPGRRSQGAPATWVAAELSFGNGFLKRPEQREQYKLNGLRAWTLGNHSLTLFGVGYYGFSRIPGLIPLFTPVLDDTLNPNQKDLSHTALAIATDSWQPTSGQQLDLSAFARTYSLALDSDFGSGLIEQSEFRTVEGANATYTRKPFGASRWTLLAGADYRRDAPRNLDLAHADSAGVLRLVTSNDLTIADYAPFAAFEGGLGHSFVLYAGLRRDQIQFGNTDRLNPTNSFQQTPGVTSPKLTLTWGREEGSALPQLSLSYGKAFHENDPRIGSAVSAPGAAASRVATPGQLIVQSREYQLIAGKVLAGTEFRLTLAHQTNSEELAKIDPDTGLQQDVGPSINRYITVLARRRYAHGFLQASYSQANATDRLLHQPLPEAPRLILDAIATRDRLPFGMALKTEFEYVGEKPLGDGFRAVPIQETRIDLQKALGDGRWLLSANGTLVHGASGQTLETFALPGEPAPLERIVGVPLRSYGSLGLQYRFGR